MSGTVCFVCFAATNDATLPRCERPDCPEKGGSALMKMLRAETSRAPKLESTPEMRARIRELASPPRDDFDRAVIALLNDFDRIAPASEDK
jgi:hypothetical protein